MARMWFAFRVLRTENDAVSTMSLLLFRPSHAANKSRKQNILFGLSRSVSKLLPSLFERHVESKLSHDDSDDRNI